MATVLHYFTEFGTFGASYIKVIEVDPYCLQQKCSSEYLLFSSL